MKVSIEKRSDGSYVAFNTTGDNVKIIGTGETVAQAKTDFFNSLNEIKDCYAEIGGDMPKCLSDDIEYHFDIASLF